MITSLILGLTIAQAPGAQQRMQMPEWHHRWGAQYMSIPAFGRNYTIYMPGDLRPGERVSGSIFAEGEGAAPQTDRDRLGGTLRVNGKEFSIRNGGFTVEVPNDANYLSFDLGKGESSETHASLRVIGSNAAAPGDFYVRAVAASGSAIYVAGPFDGDRKNTFVRFDGRPVGVLTESPRACTFAAPINAVGAHRVSISENGRVLDAQVNVVQLTVMAPAHAIRRGSKDAMGVQIEGLEGLKKSSFPITVQLINDNPNVMQFVGPDAHRFDLQIMPEDVSNDHALKSVPIKGKGNGHFLVSYSVFSAR